MSEWYRWLRRRRGPRDIGPVIAPAIARILQDLDASDHAVRARAIDALVASPLDVTLPVAAITELFAHADRAIRVDAITAIGKIERRGAEAIPALIERLGDEDAGVRRAARIAVLRVDHGARSLLAALQHANERVRKSALAALPRLTTLNDPPIDALVESLNSDEPATRTGIVDTLVAIGTPACDALARALNDARLRRGAVTALGRIERTRPLPLGLLVGALADDDRDLRQEVAKLIAHEDEEDTIPLLVDALHDRRLRRGAVDVLRLLGERASPAAGALAEVAHDLDTTFALSAIDALQHVGRSAIPHLSGLLDDPDLDAPFLRRTEHDESLRLYGIVLQRETLSRAVCRALARLEAQRELVVALENPRDLVRLSVVRAIAQLNTHGAIVDHALIRALTDHSADVRDAATDTLARNVTDPQARLALLLGALEEGQGEAPDGLWSLATSESVLEILIQRFRVKDTTKRSLLKAVVRRIVEGLSHDRIDSAWGDTYVVDYRALHYDDILRMRDERPDLLETLSHLHASDTASYIMGPTSRWTREHVAELAAHVRRRQRILSDAEEALTRPTTEAPRWILAKVFDRSGPAASAPTPAFRADARHELHVILSAERDDWLVARGHDASESIDRKVSAGTHDLTVVLFLPTQGTTQMAQLVLPPTGPSPVPAIFQFDVGRAGETVDALISVVYRGRVLQTAVLSGVVVDDPATAPASARLTLRLQVVVPDLTDLQRRERFDAAVLATVGPDGGPVAGGVVDGAAGPEDVASFQQPGIHKAARNIRDLLDEVVTDPAVQNDLTSETSRQLLWKLAQEGRLLYEAIGQPLERKLRGRDLTYLQLVQLDPDAFIPIEFVYGLPVPANDATLCTNWQQALQGLPCTSEHHLTNALGHLEVVCPSGFWGVSKVIERQAVSCTTAADLRGSDFALRAEPTAERTSLPPVRDALFAWSEKLDYVVAGTSTGVLQSLNDATHAHAAAADTWQNWAKTIDERRPELLVLLSHTVENALEIGPENSGQRATAAMINRQFVKKLPQDAPIVFLLGCSTAVADRQLTSFVARLRDQGAALVVGTITPVLGERSAVVVKSVVKKLAATREHAIPFGVLMRETRRELLANGELTGLCAAAFGDASWLVP